MNDKAFAALRNDHRRALLLALLDQTPQTDPTPITAGGKFAPSDTDQLFRTAMYHEHLPKLEDYGFIRLDKPLTRSSRGHSSRIIAPSSNVFATTPALRADRRRPPTATR